MIETKNPFSTQLTNIMTVRDLKMHFPVTKGLLKHPVGAVKAVDGVSFDIKRGQTLGLVGESGSGKSTIGNCLIHRIQPTSGDIVFEGTNLKNIDKKTMRLMRRTVQMITQDPFASLDPRFTVGECIAEGLRIHHLIDGKKAISERVREMLDMVGLRPEVADRYPHEFSGGQRQRISIARSLALQPSFIVCDEIVSALDVSIQAQVLNLLMSLQDELGLSYLFISHDLNVVRHISNRVGVMYLGRIVETGDTEEVYTHPLHPYTQALLSAIPRRDPSEPKTRIHLQGDVPSPANPPSGCPFHNRCPQCMGICKETMPQAKDMGGGHLVSCHLFD